MTNLTFHVEERLQYVALHTDNLEFISCMLWSCIAKKNYLPKPSEVAFG